ncbi:MAG: HEPN domain-containing protein [Trichlorobacter sp.]|uniref:HEPN domain-containing protein n=1 Tax=Trichlorobacter sp. TaxID=2911007 RepID=UPI002568CA2A|nr:HEPN domain-containing protein [Trichlorobacter sp.]MDK9716937.1 HEPN domain-containing protein [Trichlorobacter sp.]
MQPLTSEWTLKAEGDLATARRELRARSAPNYDAACFHAQQCAEKYLKALLQEAEIPFGKTHNLTLLLDLLKDQHPTLELIRPTLAMLSAYAVEYRYSGESADKDVARQAVKMTEEVKQLVVGFL